MKMVQTSMLSASVSVAVRLTTQNENLSKPYKTNEQITLQTDGKAQV
jgi:hypothetical protein